MKTPEKNKSGFLPERYWDFAWIIRSSFVRIPEERFEHWGCLVYTRITSKLITLALASKISKN